MYDNIASLRFEQGPNGETMATAMISAEGEVMEYREHVAAEGRVEDWMTEVLAEMRRTNRLITKEAIFFYMADGKTRYQFLLLCRKQKYRFLCPGSNDLWLGTTLAFNTKEVITVLLLARGIWIIHVSLSLFAILFEEL